VATLRCYIRPPRRFELIIIKKDLLKQQVHYRLVEPGPLVQRFYFQLNLFLTEDNNHPDSRRI